MTDILFWAPALTISVLAGLALFWAVMTSPPDDDDRPRRDWER